MPSRSIVPVVTVERRWRSRRAGRRRAGGRVGSWPQGRVGPVQLGDLRGRAPGEVVLAGLGEQVVAGVVDAVGEVEAGRAFGDQRPMPRPLAAAATSRRAASKARTAARKSPTAQARSASSSRSRCRKLSGASAARAASHRVTSSSSDSRPPRSSPSAGAGLPGEGQPAQQVATAVG